MKPSEFTTNKKVKIQLNFKNLQISQKYRTQDENQIDRLTLSMPQCSKQKKTKGQNTHLSDEIKNQATCGYSTYEDEDQIENFSSELCQDYFYSGYCMKGSACQFLHEQFDNKKFRRQLKLQITQEFPQLLGTIQRSPTFLA